jgi:hypothetical protein
MGQTDRAADDGNTKGTAYRQGDNGNRFFVRE